RKAACADPRPVGTVVLEMLRALSVRGPDSVGIALYGMSDGDSLRVRVKLGDGEPDPGKEPALLEGGRAFTAVQELSRQGECVRRGVQPADPERLEREILRAVDGAEVFSIGTRLELVKQVGHPDELDRQFHVAEMAGTHALGHTRLSTESRVDISHSQPFWTH